VTDRQERRAVYVRAGLSGFYTGLGMGSPPLIAPVIEAYCLQGLAGAKPSTKGTYRSVLRKLSGEPAPRRAPRFAGSRARPPYSLCERAELYAIARAQRCPWRRHSALALIGLGMGGGLRTAEIVATRGTDLVRVHGGVEIAVHGDLARTVRLRGDLALVLRDLARAVGEAHLFHPETAERSYANFVNDFCRHLVRDPASPELSVGRLRSSYICDHLASRTQLSELLELTGIAEVESLLRYCAHVEDAPRSKAELRRRLAEHATRR
jgi:integrase